MDQLQMRHENTDLANEICRHRIGQLQPEKIFDLRAEDEHSDTTGEPDGYGIGNVFNHRAQASKTHDQEDDSGHDRANEEIAGAVLLADAVKDDTESAGTTSDG